MTQRKQTNPVQLTLPFRTVGTPDEQHAWARAVVASLRGPTVNRRLSRLEAAADAGFDTWEDYRGER